MRMTIRNIEQSANLRHGWLFRLACAHCRHIGPRWGLAALHRREKRAAGSDHMRGSNLKSSKFRNSADTWTSDRVLKSTEKVIESATAAGICACAPTSTCGRFTARQK
jgi:hypothetical protein